MTESPRLAPELPEGGPARRRDQILRTAAELFAADGYTSTSMREVAAAAGILKGSLYHHFESKEAIALELVAAYHEDLVRAARDFAAVEGDAVTALRLFTREVAEVSFRHRAALQITMYDMPATGGPALTAAARVGPASLERRWRTLISAASAQGALRPGVDPLLLRRVLHRASVQAGAAGWEWLGVGGTTGDVADCITTIIFDGLAGATDGGRAAGPAGRPAALRVVNEARARWKAEAAGSGQERPARILAAARGQFALRGFEATTMRDIADAAGITAGNLYRYVESKDSLIAEVLGAFSDRLTDAFREVLSAGSTAAQALDAIVWLLYQAGRQFSAEVEILQGFGRMVALGVAGRYQEGAPGPAWSSSRPWSPPGSPTASCATWGHRTWWPPACGRSHGPRCATCCRPRRRAFAFGTSTGPACCTGPPRASHRAFPSRHAPPLAAP